jgi:hypothetical protein
MFHIYLQRKCRALDRLLASYIKPDGSSVGVPPELKDASPPCAQVLQLVVSIQAEVFTYARWVEWGSVGPPLLVALPLNLSTGPDCVLGSTWDVRKSSIKVTGKNLQLDIVVGLRKTGQGLAGAAYNK